MGEIKKPLNPNVVFNGETLHQIIIKNSAQRHWGKKSADILLYIASTLNGQNREPDEPSNDPKKNVYKVASYVALDNRVVPQ